MRNAFNLVFLTLCSALIFSSCEKENVTNVVSNIPPVVNAGANQSVTSTTAALNGNATSVNGNIVSYHWSLISGPNVPVIASPGSPTTQVSELISGNYLFQLVAIDETGLSGIDSTSITNSGPTILTLQPANNNSEVNFAINGTDVSNQNIGLSPAAWTGGGNPFFIRAAFKFDFSSIPSSATILSAKLTLYSNPTPNVGNMVDANSGSNNSFFIQRITSPWTVGTTNWSTQPSVSNADQLSVPHTSQTFLDIIDLDVTGLVSSMVTQNNYGFMLRLQNEVPFTIRQFASSIHPNASKHPKIVITYQ